MEDTHEAFLQVGNSYKLVVLILIVMEDTHEGTLASLWSSKVVSLNPYCNGRYS